MNTAVDDGLRKRNPCRIDGAGQEHSPERPILTVTQVFALADAFTERRYRLLMLAVFCSLRWGNWPRLPATASTPMRASSPCVLPWSSWLAVRSSQVRQSPLQAGVTS